MSEFKVELLEKQLRELRRLTPSVLGSVILSMEGLPIAADLPKTFGEERLAARAASMVALGERIAAELRRGGLSQIFISGSDGYVVVAVINDEAALMVMYRADARVAMAILDVNYSIQELGRLLG